MKGFMVNMFKGQYTHYIRNTLIPFANGAFLAVALTNIIVIFSGGGGFSLGAQAVITLMPLFFWFIVMTFSHPWMKELPHKTRAGVMSLEAASVIFAWMLMTSFINGLIAVQAVLLQLLVLFAFVVASYFNAFLTSKEESNRLVVENEVGTPTKKPAKSSPKSSTSNVKKAETKTTVKTQSKQPRKSSS